MVKVGCYAVARGRVPGIYMEWSDCEAQVINFKGAKYKKFLHAADAELWVHQNAVGPYAAPKTSPVAASHAAPQADVSSSEARESSSPQAPSAKPASSSAKTRTASSSLRDGERARSQEPRVIPQHSTPSTTGSRESVINTMSSNTLIVFTDGSCIGNGKVGSVAGIGVWWGEDDPRNISERCPGQQTNNRAELIAIIRVLETTPKDRPLLIKSDSDYSIKSMTQWICTWKTRGWRTSTGSAVQNLPVIKYLDVLLEERRRVLKQSVQFEKVPAHSGLEGNEGADVLAKAGATLPPIPDPDWEALAQKVRDRIDAAPSSQASPARRPGSVLRTLPSPQKTQVQRAPSQPAATLSQALAKPTPPLAAPKEKPPPWSTLHHSNRASPTTPRQPSVWQAPKSTSSASTSTSTSTSTVTSTSGRIPRIPLSLNDVAVHGSLDVKISQEEKEAFAACWLDDDDFLREAQEAGLSEDRVRYGIYVIRESQCITALCCRCLHPDQLKHVFVEVLHSTDGEVGRLEALQIKRFCRPGVACIFGTLDDQGPEVAQFARTLFQVEDGIGHGHLRPELINHEHLKGTGVWGQEHDRSVLLYVENILIYERRHRGKGLPSRMLQKLAQCEHAPAGSLLIARPVPEAPEEPLSDEKRAALISLYHKNGYRRIGRTSYMGYSKNPLHASRSLPVDNDVEEQRYGSSPIVLGMPLHDIIKRGPLDQPVPDVDRAIRLVYAQDPGLIKVKNESGFTPLQMAVRCENVSAVRSLLALPTESGTRAELDLHDHPQGLSPEEACRSVMSTTRRMLESVTGTWPGWTFANGAPHVLYLLKHARGELPGISEGAFVHTVRWGCTCGQCADGWLSPRMRYRLMETARRRADAMKRTIRGLKQGPVPNVAPGMEAVPADVCAGDVSKAFYEGYEVCVRAIASVLERPGDAGLPLPGLVHAAVGDRADQFLLKRGRVEHALDFIVYAARSESLPPRGSGAWDVRQRELCAHGDEHAVAYARMVQCENDFDFPRVAERAGLPDQFKYHAHGELHQPGGAESWLPVIAAGMGLA